MPASSARYWRNDGYFVAAGERGKGRGIAAVYCDERGRRKRLGAREPTHRAKNVGYGCTIRQGQFETGRSEPIRVGSKQKHSDGHREIAAGLVGLGELGVVELGHFNARHEGTKLLRRLENRNRAGRNFHR